MPDGLVTTNTQYDRNSRVVSKTDDRGNTTSAGYDSRDRPIFSRTADGALSYTVYDADSMVTQTVDRNGSALSRSYDGAGRLLKVQASRLATNLEGLGQAVEGTTLQAFEYDGLHRLRRALDDNGESGKHVVTDFSYDSLSRKLTETTHFRVTVSVMLRKRGILAFGPVPVGA